MEFRLVLFRSLSKADKVIIGGGMAYTFLKSQGKEIGKSLLEEDKIELAGSLLEKAGNKIVLPVDVVAADDFDPDAAHETVYVDEFPADKVCMDIGVGIMY